MGTLASRSALVLALLFGLVFAVGTGVAYYYEVSVGWAILLAVVVVFLQYLLGPWIIGLLFKIQWVQPEELGPEFAQWFRQACAARHIRVPRLGVIQDGNPNAFTYGHTPGDARVVITAGALEMLEIEEVEAVIAHELGHVSNYDFIVMTVAQLVPMILYILYRWSRNRVRGNREGAMAVGVAVGAYIAYIASQYIVLFLSRIREYYADEASARTTHQPDKLSTALVKISYGLAMRPATPEPETDEKGKKKAPPAFDPGRATAALGICNAAAASGFAMTAAGPDGKFSPTLMAEAMQWDLVNPWGKWFELNSTHPLTARRVIAMNRMARQMGLPADEALEPSRVGRAYTGKIAVEFAVYVLPIIGALAGLAAGYAMAGSGPALEPVAFALIGLGLGWLVKTVCCYPRVGANVRQIRDLVSTEMGASHVNPIPCAIEGTIIGRGVPGLFYSPDLVLHDDTGFLTMQYRQPFGILEFLFGWLKAGEYVNRKARVYGWYRRAPVPYLEIQRVEMLDYNSGNVRCYAYYGFYIMAALIGLAGLVMLLLAA